MALAEETISIIRLDTGEAVKSVNDLRENVKILKERLGDLEIGSTKYQATLIELKQNQDAVKDAMYATNASMTEVAASAKGLHVNFDEHNKLIKDQNVSYNALVHTMAELKTAWRSTTEEATRDQLGEQIKQINDELKGMDASVGNFSRNVGDYTNSIKKALGDFPSFADPAKKAIKGVNDTASLLAGNPVMGVIALVTPLVVKLTESLKEDESSMAAIQKVMNSMKPIMDFFQAVLGNVVSFIGDIIDHVGEFLGSSGLFNKIMNGIIGVGNAIVQYVIAPFKGIAAAIKVFQEEGIKGIGNAAKAFANEAKNGFAFKQNFLAGQNIADSIVKGAESKKPEVNELGKGLGKELGKGVEEGLKLADWTKALAEGDKKMDALRKYREQEQKEIDALVETETAAVSTEVAAVLDELNRAEEEKQKKLEDIAAARMQTLNTVASSTSSILGSIADMYESDEESAEKNADKIKALRIATATIDTIQGAVGAYMQAAGSIAPPFGQIIGAAQAAAITAAGFAQIAKIRSTNMKGTSTPSVSAIQSAPAAESRIPQIRNVTSASEEVRLNRMADDSRVVLVMSDLEVKQGQRKVQLAESSF